MFSDFPCWPYTTDIVLNYFPSCLVCAVYAQTEHTIGKQPFQLARGKREALLRRYFIIIIIIIIILRIIIIIFCNLVYIYIYIHIYIYIYIYCRLTTDAHYILALQMKA